MHGCMLQHLTPSQRVYTGGYNSGSSINFKIALGDKFKPELELIFIGPVKKTPEGISTIMPGLEKAKLNALVLS